MTHLFEKQIIAVAASENRLRHGSHRLVYSSTAWLCEIATGATETYNSVSEYHMDIKTQLNKVGLQFFGHLIFKQNPYKGALHITLPDLLDWWDSNNLQGQLRQYCLGGNCPRWSDLEFIHFWSNSFVSACQQRVFLQIIGKVCKGCFVKLGRRGAPSLSRGWACLS